MNFNKHWIIPHCITVPDKTLENKKQQLFLAPCVNPDLETDQNDLSSQSFEMRNDMIAVKGANICMTWTMSKGTRMWTTKCMEYTFTRVGLARDTEKCEKMFSTEILTLLN